MYLKNKDIKSYLNNLTYRNYDFDIKFGLSPLQNNTIEEIIILRNDLKLLDYSMQVILKGLGINDTIKEIYYSEKFKEYLTFDRIGLAIIKDDMVVANINYSAGNKLKLNRGYSIKLSDSESLRITCIE